MSRVSRLWLLQPPDEGGLPADIVERLLSEQLADNCTRRALRLTCRAARDAVDGRVRTFRVDEHRARTFRFDERRAREAGAEHCAAAAAFLLKLAADRFPRLAELQVCLFAGAPWAARALPRMQALAELEFTDGGELLPLGAAGAAELAALLPAGLRRLRITARDVDDDALAPLLEGSGVLHSLRAVTIWPGVGGGLCSAALTRALGSGTAWSKLRVSATVEGE